MTLSTATVSEQPENLSSRPTPSCPSSEKKERVRLIRDGLVNYAVYASASLAGMVLVPILLRDLRPELYGLWIAATPLEYSASFLHGGLGRSVAREVTSTRMDG